MADTDFVNGLKSISGLRRLSCEMSDFVYDAAEELERLKRIESAARYYYEHYCQDEAEEEEICLDHEQHLAAKALRDALISVNEK